MKRSKAGVNTSTIEFSPKARQRYINKRKREEAEWAAKCGPVKIYPIGGTVDTQA